MHMSTDYQTEDEEVDEARGQRRSRPKKKPRTTRVLFYGVTFDIPEDQDPDDFIERYVASGKHALLERTAPDVAAMITSRFIKHQEWLDSKKGKKHG